jgi:hypothetical protein
MRRAFPPYLQLGPNPPVRSFPALRDMLTRMRPRHGVAALRRFVQAQPVERCELCAAMIGDRHPHLLEPGEGRLLCACLACAYAAGARADGRFRLVPDRVEALADFRISDAEWHALGLPVEMAWLFHSTPAGRPIAVHPGPAGATQSLVMPDAWQALVARNPILANFEADVEALLVNRTGGRQGYYRVPIDRCFELVGLIRTQWQGWSGGDAVWQAIDDYFARLAPGEQTTRDSAGGRAA